MGRRHCRMVGAAGWTSLLLVLLAWVTPVGAGPGWRFSAWSEPVNLGAVNTLADDGAPAISKDELELYITSNRPGGFGGNDIWVSTRMHKTDPWGPPQNLTIINTSGNDSTPALSRDGHLLYFASDRPGGFGNNDIWVSVRVDTRDPLGWQKPVNLGPAVNTSGQELGPALFEDRSTQTFTLYFYSIRPGTGGTRDIFSSSLDENGEFTPAVPVAELNTACEDEQPSIRRDGLEIFFASTRQLVDGQLVDCGVRNIGSDIWVSTRLSPSDPWSPPVNLGPVINTPEQESAPVLSFGATHLYFRSNGHSSFGGGDLFVSTRIRLDDGDDDDGDSDDD